MLHKLTTTLTRNSSVIVIEDLSASGRLANHHPAKAVADASFYEFRRQVEYKAKRQGVILVIADRFYPSSKTCSACGAVKAQLGLGEREYCCETCGQRMDRDVNAARNLAALGNIPARSSRTVNGRGGGSADGYGDTTVKLPSLKRQPGAT